MIVIHTSSELLSKEADQHSKRKYDLNSSPGSDEAPFAFLRSEGVRCNVVRFNLFSLGKLTPAKVKDMFVSSSESPW